MKIKNQTVRKYYKYVDIPWVQPLLTGDSGTSTSVTTPEGTIYSCNWTRGASYAMSYAFDGIIPTTYSPQCACFVRRTGQSNWVEVYNPNPIKVSQIIIYWSSGSSYTITETINIEASNDGINYVTLVNGATHNASATISPHTISVNNNNNFYNYYKITNTTDNGGYWYVGEIQITATQKTIVESTSSDYDFYEDVNVYKVLQKTVRKYYKYVDTAFTTPVLSNDGLLDGYMFAVEGLPRRASYAWHLFDGSASTVFSPYNQDGAIGDTHLIMFNPDLLNITNLAMTNRSATSGAAVRAGAILVSNDNASYTQIKSFTNDVTAPLATWNIDLSNNTGFYKYYKIQFTEWDYNSTYARALAEIELTATERSIVLSDESNYDYYEDVNAYMAVV